VGFWCGSMTPHVDVCHRIRFSLAYALFALCFIMPPGPLVEMKYVRCHSHTSSISPHTVVCSSVAQAPNNHFRSVSTMTIANQQSSPHGFRWIALTWVRVPANGVVSVSSGAWPTVLGAGGQLQGFSDGGWAIKLPSLSRSTCGESQADGGGAAADDDGAARPYIYCTPHFP
jgi:hypothetical protein